MIRKIFLSISFVLVLSIAGNASADLVAHWKFDEGSGTTATDATGNGHDGKIMGNPQWVSGYFDGALQFAGEPDVVLVPYSAQINPENEFTVMLWANVKPGSTGWRSPISSRWPGYNIYAPSAGIGSNTWEFWVGLGPGWASTGPGPAIQEGEWIHIAGVYDNSNLKLYGDGELRAVGSGTMVPNTADEMRIGAGGLPPNLFHYFVGMLDDVRIYNKALNQTEILVAMEGTGDEYLSARNPNPEDGALYENTWAVLSWKAGDFAVSHDLYFGTNFKDVNDGVEGTFVGNIADTFYEIGFPPPATEILQLGTTYYWRVDEVNEADPHSPWKGNVWSFLIPPMTAYEPVPADGARFIEPDVELRWAPGFDAKLHTVYFGDNFDDVNNADGGLIQETTSYIPNPLEFAKTYYWRVDEIEVGRNAVIHKGDVWSFETLPYIPINDPNLMGWWKLDEGLGTTVVDWSGHGNHGWFQGDPHWVAGYNGGAIEFDGDDYVNTGYTENLPTWTISCWVISPEAPSEALPSGPLQRERNYNINWNHNIQKFRGAAVLIVDGAWHVASFGQLQANTWYHLTATYDRNALKAYRDGVLITTNNAPSGNPEHETLPLILGRHSWLSQFFIGTVDDVRVYNKALAVEEIKKVMEGNP